MSLDRTHNLYINNSIYIQYIQKEEGSKMATNRTVDYN